MLRLGTCYAGNAVFSSSCFKFAVIEEVRFLLLN